jgi:ankyrin repeat protein
MAEENPPGIVLQRWLRPLNVEPGHWKKQLPGKYLGVAKRGSIPALSALLREHPAFLNQRGGGGRTLLWEAARAGRLAAVTLLVEQGADVNANGCYNNETMVRITPYCAARYYEREDVAEYLAGHGSKLDIFRAAFLGDERRVAEELDARPESLDAEDPHDEIYFAPVLAFAVAGGHAGLTEQLIRRGAAVAPYTTLLLHLAGRASRKDLVEMLVAAGADVRALDSAIFVAVPDVEILRYFLERGLSPTERGSNGFTPLEYVTRADKAKRPDKVELLREYGAGPVTTPQQEPARGSSNSPRRRSAKRR